MKALCLGRSLERAGANPSGFDSSLFYLNQVECESPAPSVHMAEFGALEESQLSGSGS